MAEKIFIGDDSDRNYQKQQAALNDKKPETYDDLKQRCSKMAIMADVELITKTKARVLVLESSGTTMYMASAPDDIAWLNFHSDSKEKKGSSTLYYFRIQGE